MGQAPPGKSYNDEGHGLPLIAGAGDFHGDRPAAKKFTTSSSKVCAAGDIVLGIRASIGAKVWSDDTYSLGRGVAGLRPRSNLDGHYLWHWLSSASATLAGKGRGATFLQVNRQDIAEMVMPLPPLVEQRRIAAILDRADDLRARRQRAIQQLEGLTEAIFLDMFGYPRTHSSFESRSLTETCALYSGGTPSKAANSNWTGNLPWFSPKDLKADDRWDSTDHISPGVTERTSLRRLREDTVVMVVRGMILAHSVPVAVLRCESTINQDLKALVPKEPVDAQFLATCVRVQRPDILASVSTAAHGTKRLDARALEEIRIVRPGPNLEREFVRRARMVESERRVAETSAISLKEVSTTLQAHAFAGEL
jgi:type I restriction enzyme S subunit